MISKSLKYIVIFFILTFYGLQNSYSANLKKHSDKVMTLKEFKKILNSDQFLIARKDTPKHNPLIIEEIEAITEVNKKSPAFFNKNFKGRNVKSFLGDTLVIGGGKKSGISGDNQGKTVLINVIDECNNIDLIIKKIESGDLKHNQHTGQLFKSKKEKLNYIKTLYEKKDLYKKAFELKNTYTLERYYTLNIDSSVEPDMLGSITSKADMKQIPDHRFDNVEFENVPCSVFLNPSLYPNLERITKIGGKISLSISNSCRRLIIPVIKKTKFGLQFLSQLENKYTILQNMHPTYHRINIDVINFNYD
ncbi:hypothetical protein MPCS_01611 (plasmid) [Candidatus Megaera polyxenophila]|nr:hypothetical protein MPCS_01611 [Candidatus Megaera polyxenophila]